MPRLILSSTATALAFAYVVILWRMTRQESSLVKILLLGIVLVATALRLVFTYEYPPGIYPDEILHLVRAWQRFTGQAPLFSASDGAGMSMVLYAVVQGALWQFVPAWWAIRLFGIIGGILSVVGIFATARAMGRSTAGALFAAGCASVLPWALLYGRSSMGGEIIWHETIATWALARCIWHDGDWTDAASITFALSLLFYDYFAGRAVIWFVIAMMPILRRRQRWLVAAAVMIAVAAYIPATVYASERTFVGFGSTGMAPPAVWVDRAVRTLKSLATPAADDAAMSLPGAAVMPVLLLSAGVLGLLWADVRTKVYLVLLLVVGLLPCVVGYGFLSTHRMLAGFCATPLASAVLIDVLPRFRPVIAGVALVIIAYQSTTTFFSDRFWTGKAGGYCEYACGRCKAGSICGWPAQWAGRPFEAWREPR